MNPLDEAPALNQFYTVQEPFYSNQLQRVHNHEFQCKKKKRMKLIRTVERGLCSIFHFRCSTCNKRIKVSSHTEEAIEEQNKGAVWGSIAAGFGHHQTEEFLAHMGLNMMCKKSYRKAEEKLYEV